MPSKLKKAIGAVKDQTSIGLAKVASNHSTTLEVAVLKATTHDVVPIDDRHVYEILQLVSSNKVYATACARAIGKRIGRTRNWAVALKSLMLVLRIFQDGDPYFPREVLHAMKRGAKILNLTSFRDDSNSSPWDFTAFVRTFALYLDERLDCFLTGKLQRRYTHRERGSSSYQRTKRPNEPVRDMKPAMLLDRISYWQRLLERAIATRPTGAAKMNRLVQICLYAVVQESFDLYKDISDGHALLLDSFFHLQYQNCVSAFQTCVKAAKQFEELSGFYTLCKSMGVGRNSEYPSIQVLSEELIETLQEFLKDQSSFPTNAKSPNRLLLPAPPNADQSWVRCDSYGGRSEVSATTDGFSERTSELDSQCTSLEELISATETGKSPSISIDLEAYSDQYEKPTQQDDSFRVSDTGSSQSLPMSNSMVDLVSLDDWSDQDEKEHERDQEQEQKPKGLESTSAMDWEIVIAETITASPQVQPFNNATNSFNAFPEQEQPQTLNDTDNSTNGWELVLFNTETQTPQQVQNSNTFSASSLESLYDQTPTEMHNPHPVQTTNTCSTSSLESLYNQTLLPPNQQSLYNQTPLPPNQESLYSQNPLPTNHYNPFLQDAFEFPAAVSGVTAPTIAAATDVQPTVQVAHTFQLAPSFQATPTFSVQNPNEISFPAQIENDPFAPYPTAFSGGDMFNSSMNEQNLLQEQQLWLQNQNKIIAKHNV